MSRPSKKEYYINLAKEISKRSPCLKLKVGAIIVKDDSIISTGYNGPHRGYPHCTECSRKNIPDGKSYDEACPAIHAEENAIINAARNGISVKGGEMYLYNLLGLEPCYRCKRVLINSGINKVIVNG